MITDNHPFSPAERERFRNLLRLAAESPFANERANALAAAERLAARYDLTLDEAAMERPSRPEPVVTITHWNFTGWAPGSFIHLTDFFIKADKSRLEEALREARNRGLDGGEVALNRPPRPGAWARPRGGKRNEYSHARILLQETSLPLRDVAGITGLDIYQVVGLKLKMRAAA